MSDKIFVDTNPLIYYLNDHEPFASKFYSLMKNFIEHDAEFYTSTITDAEILLKLYTQEDQILLEKYNDFLKSINFLKCYITEAVAKISAQIRLKYPFLKLADSLQIASAIECSCNIFITNDKQLKKVKELNVKILNDISL